MAIRDYSLVVPIRSSTARPRETLSLSPYTYSRKISKPRTIMCRNKVGRAMRYKWPSSSPPPSPPLHNVQCCTTLGSNKKNNSVANAHGLFLFYKDFIYTISCVCVCVSECNTAMRTMLIESGNNAGERPIKWNNNKSMTVPANGKIFHSNFSNVRADSTCSGVFSKY